MAEVYPELALDGQPVSLGDPAAGLVALFDLSISWGAGALFERPEAATMTLRIFDPSPGALVSGSRIGQSVTVVARAPFLDEYTGTFPNMILTSEARWQIFTGRVQAVSAAPFDLAGRSGVLLTLTCASPLVELANLTPTGTFPAETLEARRARLSAAVAAHLPAGLVTRADLSTRTVQAVPGDQQRPLADQLYELAEVSPADVAAVTPTGMTVAPRRTYPLERGLVELARDDLTDTFPTPPAQAYAGRRAGFGAYARTLPLAPPGGAASARLFLDDVIDPAGELLQGPGQRISRAEVSWTAVDGTTAVEVLLVTAADEARHGVRAAQASTLFTQAGSATLVCRELADALGTEGAQWQPPPLLWTSRTGGGFGGGFQAVSLLSAYPRSDIWLLSNAWWSDQGVRPVVGIVGGVIAYAGGHWRITLNPAPVSTDVPQHAISWENIDAGGTSTLRWSDGEPSSQKNDGLHRSLTWRDIGWVARGLGVTSIPPDAGFDTYTPGTYYQR